MLPYVLATPDKRQETRSDPVAAKRKSKSKASKQWVAVPIALFIAAIAAFVLLRTPTPASSPGRASGPVPDKRPVSAEPSYREEIGEDSRDRLRQILRDAEEEDGS